MILRVLCVLRVDRRLAVLAACVAIAASALPARAQTAAPADKLDVDAVDPIRCWWRTSTSAVRIGEPFTLVLTCAVVENESIRVIPDQSKLEPGALSVQPFEVLTGSHSPDLRTDQRRFFQYQYTLRVVSEDLFGKDAKLPAVTVDYHVETRVGRGEAVRGRDLTYNLPAESIRVMSMVPADAADIRDAPAWTFGDIDRQRFRARALYIAATVLEAAGALILIAALVSWFRHRHDKTAVRRPLLTDAGLLGVAARELRAGGRARQAEGWTTDLVGRALAALRIAGTVGMGQRAGQIEAGPRQKRASGQVAARAGVLGTKRVLVSGSATADAIAKELASNDTMSNARRAALESVQSALERFTRRQFAREQGTADEVALDESVSESLSAIRRLRIESLWPVRRIRGLSMAAGLGTRAWSR